MKDDRHLHDLLTTFGAVSLGEGDLAAGANTLAAMACSLANIARPGSGLKDKEGRTFKVGTSLLVSGSHSPGLVADQVAIELGRRQRNTNSYIVREAAAIEEAARKSLPGQQAAPPAPRPNLRESTLEELQNPLSPVFETGTQGRSRALGALSEEPVRPGMNQWLGRSRIFLTGRNPGDIENQLQYAHMGYPFIYFGVDKVRDFDRFGDLAAAVMDGRATCGPMAESVRGHVLVTDVSALLGPAIQETGGSRHWLGRLVWLADGGAGPEAPGRAKDHATPILDQLGARYAGAMTIGLGRRLDFKTAGPTIETLDYAFPQERWVAFLGEMEPTFPGITGAARTFLATLAFGLRELAGASTAPEGFKWYAEGVGALARFLVRRMANARAAFLWSAEDARRRRLKRKILFKLQDGPLRLRELYRALSLPSVPCEELLVELMTEKRVQSAGGVWQRLEPAALMTTAGHPTLEA